MVCDVEPERFAGDQRTLTDLMVDQIEFADVVVLNKIDLVSKSDLQKTAALVAKLNPRAAVLHTSFSQVEPDLVIDTGLFSFSAAMTHAGACVCVCVCVSVCVCFVSKH